MDSDIVEKFSLYDDPKEILKWIQDSEKARKAIESRDTFTLPDPRPGVRVSTVDQGSVRNDLSRLEVSGRPARMQVRSSMNQATSVPLTPFITPEERRQEQSPIRILVVDVRSDINSSWDHGKSDYFVPSEMIRMPFKTKLYEIFRFPENSTDSSISSYHTAIGR